MKTLHITLLATASMLSTGALHSGDSQSQKNIAAAAQLQKEGFFKNIDPDVKAAVARGVYLFKDDSSPWNGKDVKVNWEPAKSKSFGGVTFRAIYTGPREEIWRTHYVNYASGQTPPGFSFSKQIPSRLDTRNTCTLADIQITWILRGFRTRREGSWTAGPAVARDITSIYFPTNPSSTEGYYTMAGNKTHVPLG